LHIRNNIRNLEVTAPERFQTVTGTSV